MLWPRQAATALLSWGEGAWGTAGAAVSLHGRVVGSQTERLAHCGLLSLVHI